MKLKKHIIIIISGLLFILDSLNSTAQNSQTLYYMNRIPQSNQMNPAIQPKCNFFFGLPALSSLQVGIGNNQYVMSDVIMQHPTQDSLVTFLHPDAEFNKSDFLSKLGNNNSFFQDFQTDLLSFGFRLNSWYFSFNLSEKQSLAINYPTDLMDFALNGNKNFIYQTTDFSNLRVNANFYREYGIGVAKEINSNLFVGVRGKILFGHANIETQNNNQLGLYSSRDSIYIHADAIVNTSSPLIATTNAEGNFDGFEAPAYLENAESDSLIDLALLHQNMGLGIDLGIYYKPLDDLALSLSIIDLGYIKWDKDVTNLELKGSYSFKGVDVSDEIGADESEEDPFEQALDSLENSFTVSNQSSGYTTGLGTKIYLGASYFVSPKFDVSFLSRSYIYNNYFNQAFTLSANLRPVNGISASLSYSIMNGTYNNIGLGLVLGGAPLQLYVVTDNVSAAFWGHKTSSVNLRFGLNIAFGCKHKKNQDKPLLKSYF
ncbi:MAG: DUF5723 family protein [Bacteroidales bacterium]|jgi:hypothetical protein|nr:DUF5723 family protein [Bacteroidales bacterium]